MSIDRGRLERSTNAEEQLLVRGYIMLAKLLLEKVGNMWPRKPLIQSFNAGINLTSLGLTQIQVALLFMISGDTTRDLTYLYILPGHFGF